MLPSMFGMGGSEIIVILIVALLFLGPEKLPEVTKTISKGIRDLKKQSRVLQQTIENDEHIGGAIRDLKSALRGDEIPVRPPVRQPVKKELADATAVAPTEAEPVVEKPAVTLPQVAGEPDPEANTDDRPEELAALIKPATGTVAHGAAEAEAPKLEPDKPTAKQTHG
jgi:sec-independent protein translocase protein TatB